VSQPEEKLLRVGQLARAVGKTVRAVHLYEELGLVRPATRTNGRFRLYYRDAIDRVAWITKLQAIGFTLAEIQEFVREFEHAASGREATNRAREVFEQKLDEIKRQIAELESIQNDLREALSYLDSCQECSPSYSPVECRKCEHNGHERGSAPPLFASLSETAGEQYDVPVKDVKEASAGRRPKSHE